MKQFKKYNGLGNDFIIVDGINQSLEGENWIEKAQALCDRRTGVKSQGYRTGADGLILVLESQTQDIRMRILNSDGSEPEMCGNGIRCFAKFVYEEGLVSSDHFVVETFAGPIEVWLQFRHDLVNKVAVDMGKPTDCRDVTLTIQDQEIGFRHVSMGNPHIVTFMQDVENVPLAIWGPLCEKDSQFPDGVNTEFCEVVDVSHVKMRVWERGSGETMACGTGACAVVVAGVEQELLSRVVVVHLPGGDLDIEWLNTGRIMMIGPVSYEFSGSF